MKDLLNNKLFWVFIVFCFLTVFTILFSNKIVNLAIKNHYDEIAEVMIKKLQKEYSPSPYGPGLNPDKVDIDAMLSPKNTEWESVWGSYRSNIFLPLAPTN